MKRALVFTVLMLPLFALTACIMAKPMQVTYNVRTETSLKDYTVYLVVNDRRPNTSLVGPEAQAKELFTELRGGRFDLKVNMPNGSMVAMSNLTTIEAVREAVSRRLQSQGVTSTAHRAAAHLTVEVNIEQMLIDVAENDLVARVTLATEIYRDASSVSKSNAGAVANRMKLIGGTGGATVLSEALSQAVNDLDFSSINRF